MLWWGISAIVALFLAPGIKVRMGYSYGRAWFEGCCLSIAIIITITVIFGSVISVLVNDNGAARIGIAMFLGGCTSAGIMRIYGKPNTDRSWVWVLVIVGLVVAALGITSDLAYPLTNQPVSNQQTSNDIYPGDQTRGTIVVSTRVPTRVVAPTPTIAYPVGCVITDTLNIRMGPGTFYKVVTALKRGSCVDIVEYMDSEWVRVKNGYMSIKFLEITGGSVP